MDIGDGSLAVERIRISATRKAARFIVARVQFVTDHGIERMEVTPVLQIAGCGHRTEALARTAAQSGTLVTIRVAVLVINALALTCGIAHLLLQAEAINHSPCEACRSTEILAVARAGDILQQALGIMLVVDVGNTEAET